MPTYFLTGGEGFIGFHMTKRLLAEGIKQGDFSLDYLSGISLEGKHITPMLLPILLPLSRPSSEQ